jgi:flavin-dependent dehydrogenase
MRKHGIEFVSAYHGKSVTYDFSGALDKRFPYAFQVRRSSFDHILLQNAAAKGALVIEDCRVTGIDFPPGGDPQIAARDGDGTARHWTARFVVDASGRDTLVAAQLGFKERNPRNNSAAMFGHFAGARRLHGKAEGNITIVWFDNGWFWFIPLADGTTSVGAVCPAAFFKNRGSNLTDFFRRTIASCPEIARRLQDAELLGAVQATGNYSYSGKYTGGAKYLLVGDAHAFIDPVFSTGVYLAMHSAFRAAEAVAQCLDTPAHAASALRRYDAQMRRALSRFTWFIYHIREPAMRNLFMSPRNWLRMQEAVLSLLAGDMIGGWALRSRLYLFRAIYYITKFSHLRHRLFAPGRPAVQAGAEAGG